jgi:cobalt-zinc-cadmium efflux system outer membrane protein
MSNLVAVRYRAGAVSEADVARVETQRLEAEQSLDAAGRDVLVARAGLAFLLGVRGKPPPFEAQDDAFLKAGPPLSAAGLDEAKLLSDALDQRPDYRASLLDAQRTRVAASLARRNLVPELSLSLQYVQQGMGNLAVQPPTFGIVLTSPLPLFYQQQGEIGRADAEARSQELQSQRTRAQVTSDVDSAFAQLVAARKLVDRMEGGLLGRAVQARDLVQVQYQKGAASLLEYLDAQRTFIAANGEYLQDLKDYWTSVFRLDQAVGRESWQ